MKGWALRDYFEQGIWWMTSGDYGTFNFQFATNPPMSVKVFVTRKAARDFSSSDGCYGRWVPVKLIRDDDKHDWELA